MEAQMGRVQNKVAIVTGAASDPGLGHSSALALAREGAKLVVTDIDGAGAELCAQKVREAGGQAIAVTHDVTSELTWASVVALTVETYGRLDVLVNNAGIAVLKPLEKLTLEDWNRQIAVNMTSVFLGCRTAIPEMRKAGGGSIVNISSVAGLVGLPTTVAYGASKGGVRLMSKAIAIEFGKSNIRCNSVHPGVIWTNMQAGAGYGSREASEAIGAGLPLGRLGEPMDIANCVLYLASDESNYITGTELVVDAGMTAT
jgi:NAD(P)-dependent dehydrogenase (short-subunit alcohol dehydrogenase family)